MKEFTYTIKDALGLHARPAGSLVKLIKELGGTVMIEKEGKPAVSASALIKVMGLGVKCGETVRFTVEGGDEDAAVKAVEEFLNENL
ncbi:MAG: HPr family phosphocarrier protein [Ruminiclostridium sp.]|nr:HPr family phosphocarrier protein [Ruminiclostridium sp.]